MAGPTDHLTARLEAETGLSIGSTQDLTVLTAAEVEGREQAWRRSEGHPVAIPGAGQDPARHDRIARFAEHEALWDAAIFHLDRLMSLRPQDGRLRVRRALALAAVGRNVEADAEWTQALSAGPRDACLDLMLQRAVDARDAGRLDHSEWALDRIIEARPGDWWPFADRAEVRGRRGDLPGRDGDRRLAVEHGADALYLVRLAEEADADGKAARAAGLRDRAANRLRERESPYVFRSIAAHEARRGRFARAADLLERANQVDIVTSILSHYRRALTAVARGDSATYRATCRELLARMRADSPPQALSLTGWTCMLGPEATDDPERVVALVKSALERASGLERGGIVGTLGAVLVRAGRYREGIQDLEEAIRLRGGEALAQERALLAIANHALGDPTAASRWLTRTDAVLSASEDLVEGQIMLHEAVARILDRDFPADPFATRLGPDDRRCANSRAEE